MLKKLFTRNKNNTTVPNEKAKQDIPEGIMSKCPQCTQIFYRKEMKKNHYVCPNCDYHNPVNAWDRIEYVLDENSFMEWDSEMKTKNPLQFPEYEEKLKRDQEQSGLNEAIITGKGKINGHPIAIAVMDARFRMGSMGTIVGDKIARAIENARIEKIPFVIFTASGGARMQEGVLSLMQMAKTSIAIKRFSDESGLMVSMMTHPTTGGVTASFASLGDYNFAEPHALIGFAGRRVIEQTTREKLPDDFQTAEFLLKHGQLDQIIHRHEIKETLATLLKIHSPYYFNETSSDKQDEVIVKEEQSV